MAQVSRESLSEMMAEHKAQFAALQASGEVTPSMAVLTEALFSMLQLLVMLLLEKKTKKTAATSGLPGSLFPFDKTAPAKAGAKSKGPKPDCGNSANTRLEIVEQRSKVNECERCGEDLSEVASKEQQRRVIVDLEFVTTETRVDAEVKCCPNCQKINRGKFPDNMPGPLQYGPGVVAFAIDLMISQMVPLKRTAQLLKHISGRQISQATLLKWIQRMNDSLAQWECAAIERLLQMPVLHADETSIRVNRKKHWIHSCSGGDLVVKHCHPKRGAQALDDINIIPRYGDRGDADDEPHQKPVLVHDRWAAYFKYKNCDHSLCGPHLLRNLKYIEKANAHDWAIKMRRLLLDTCKEVSDADTKRLCAARFEKVSSKYTKILDDGKTELPPRPPRTGKRGRIPKSEAEKLHEAFVKYKNEILRFAERSEVPFSNNRAERDIRMAKVRQKISGTFRNVKHAHAYCRISSYLQSMSLQGYSSLVAMQIALNGNAMAMFDQSN